MSEDRPFDHPVITNEDIYRATSLLGLPANAFDGEDGTDPRQVCCTPLSRQKSGNYLLASRAD